jgi:hypothetical protein
MEIKLFEDTIKYHNATLAEQQDFREYVEGVEMSIKGLGKNIETLMNKRWPFNNETLMLVLNIRWDLVYIFGTPPYLCDLLRYRTKHCAAQKIYLPFNQAETIVPLLEQVIEAMLYLKNQVPLPKCSAVGFAKSYEMLNRFTTHGHYLPNLSGNNDNHRIGDIILYLRHMYKTVRFVYYNSVFPVEQAFSYNENEKEE